MPLTRMDIDASDGTVAGARADAWLIPFYAGTRITAPPRTPGTEFKKIVDAWMTTCRFTCALGAVTAFPSGNRRMAKTIILLGLGPRNELNPARLARAAGAAARAVAKLRIARIAVAAPFSGWAAGQASVFVSGLVRGSYELKPDAKQRSPAWRICGAGAKAVAEGHTLGDAVNGTRALANLSGRDATPLAIAAYARALARKHGMTCEVWNHSRLQRERCAALLAVAQGSANAPCLIILRHRAKDRRAPLALVGKTITFDTGGISIKPAKNMEWMRYDKSGGMAVLAAMEMIARMKIKRPVVGILAAAENMPGSRATRPGDVVTSRSGKTIEIINTDAEGRLVLADALDVAHQFHPAAIVDLATLTGAAVTAVGHVVSAVMGEDRLVKQLARAGDAIGERLWPLPLHDEYREMIGTPFADLKNTGDGTAGAIAGGMFLRQFVPAGTPWAHIDLTHAWEERETASAPAGANIFGAQLIHEWVRSFDA